LYDDRIDDYVEENHDHERFVRDAERAVSDTYLPWTTRGWHAR
jgi:hypothetical protein